MRDMLISGTADARQKKIVKLWGRYEVWNQKSMMWIAVMAFAGVVTFGAAFDLLSVQKIGALALFLHPAMCYVAIKAVELCRKRLAPLTNQVWELVDVQETELEKKTGMHCVMDVERRRYFFEPRTLCLEKTKGEAIWLFGTVEYCVRSAESFRARSEECFKQAIIIGAAGSVLILTMWNYSPALLTIVSMIVLPAWAGYTVLRGFDYRWQATSIELEAHERALEIIADLYPMWVPERCGDLDEVGVMSMICSYDQYWKGKVEKMVMTIGYVYKF